VCVWHVAYNICTQVKMNAQLVSLLNQIASSINPNEKVELVKKLQELVLHRDPAALATVFPLVLEYQRDRTVQVRQAVVDFILAVCSAHQEYIYTAMESLLMMSSDQSPNVQRKVIHTTLLLLPLVHKLFLMPSSTQGHVESKQRGLFQALCQLCKTACQFTLEKNESLGLQSLKLVESVIKLFSPCSDSSGQSPSLWDELKEGRHCISKEQVFQEAEQLLSEIMKIFKQSSEDINFQVRCAAMASLFHIMEERCVFANKIMSVVHSVIQGGDSNLSNAQKVTERSSLKSLLLSAIGVESLQQRQSILQSLELALRNLGVDESTIANAKNRKISVSTRRPPKRPYAAKSNERDSKRIRSQQYVSAEEAKTLADSLVSKYPLSTLVEMVLGKLVEVAPVLGDETTKTIEEARLGTEEQPPMNNNNNNNQVLGVDQSVSKLKRDPRLDPRLASKLARAASSTPSSVASPQDKTNEIQQQSQEWKKESQSISEWEETKKEEEQVVPLSIGHSLQKPPALSLPNYSDEMIERFSQESCKRILFAEKEASIGGGNALRLALLGRMLPNCKQDQSLYKEAIEFILEKIESRLELAIHWLYGEAAFCVSSAVREHYQKLVFDVMKKGLKDENSDTGREPWMEQTVEQLQEKLISMNVEFSKDATKSELVDLIVENSQGEENPVFHWKTMEQQQQYDLEKYVTERYKTLFYIFARQVARHLTMDDSLFAQLYVQAPILFQGAVDEVRTCIEDPSKTTAVLHALIEIMTERPGKDQMRFLDVVLDYAVHEDEVLRGPAIRLIASRLYSMDSLTEAIERFAKEKLLSFVDEIMKDSANHRLEKEEMENTEKRLQRCSSLYVVLCSRKPALLISLLQILEQNCDEQVIDLFKTYIPNLSRTLSEDSPELVEIVANHSPKVASFVLELLDSLMENGKKPSPQVLEAARKHFQDPSQPLCDVRYAIPFMDSFSKEQVVSLLPHLVALQDSDEFKRAVTKLLSARSPVMSASEFLVELHLLEPKDAAVFSLRNVIAAIQYCFELKSMFPQDAVATSLQQLVEKSPIPILLLRTVIQSILEFPQLQKFIISVIFARLIDREVWKSSRLWEGFVKACQMTVPRSVPVILRLPPQPLKDMLQQCPNIRQAIVKYGQRTKQSIPNWLWPLLLSTDEEKKENG